MATVLPVFNPIAGIPEAIQAFVARRRLENQRRLSGQQFGQAFPQFGGITDPNIQRIIAQGQFQQNAPFTLGPGQTRFAAGQPVATSPAAVRTAELRERKRFEELTKVQGMIQKFEDTGKPVPKALIARQDRLLGASPGVQVNVAQQLRQSQQDRIKNLQSLIAIVSRQAADILNPDAQKARTELARLTTELQELTKANVTAGELPVSKSGPKERITVIDVTTGLQVTIPKNLVGKALAAGRIRLK